MMWLVWQFNILSERVIVQRGDVIGWTNEEDHTLISFNFDETYATRFYDIPQNRNFPRVGETIALSPVIYRAVVSVAVEIIQR